MNKKIKFAVSCLLVISFLVATVFSTSAALATADTAKIVAALQKTEPIKQDIGLSDVDFKNLSVADPVYTYEYTDEGFIQNHMLYPLKENGELVAWAVLLEDEKTTEFQITTVLVDEVNAVLTENMELALIYDYASCYLYDGSMYHLLKKNTLGAEGRAVLQPEVNNLSDGNIRLSKMDASVALAYTTPIATRAQTYYSCSVSFVTQNTVPQSRICWAASIACIVNYKKGTSHTAIDVAQNHFGTTGFNQGLNPGAEESILRWDYYLWYTNKNQVPSDGIISHNIQKDYPIFASFRVSNGGGHAAVICGIDVVKGYIKVMDPEIGFCSATVSSLGYRYYRADVDLTLTLLQATCRYWSA